MRDAATLARIQFAFTVSFHIIFPTISIGLAMYLAVFEGLWLRTKDALYLQIYKFWLNIFAMAFGVAGPRGSIHVWGQLIMPKYSITAGRLITEGRAKRG